MAKKNIYTEDSLRALGLVKGKDGTYSRPKTVQQPREVIKKYFPPPPHIKGKGIDVTHMFEKDHVDDTRKIEELSVIWAGKDISLNAWYSSKHWTHRNKQKQEWHEFFKQSIMQPYPFFEKYSVTLEYNSRLDPSNTITMIKLFEDTLTELGVITDDTLKYCVGVHLIPKLEMKKKSYRITIKKA